MDRYTQTLVAKTKTKNGKSIRFDIDQCLDFMSQKINNSKTTTSILQIRTGFKNAFICDMYLQSPYDKTISLKICKNGSFQFTGCITVDYAYVAIKYVLLLLRELYNQPPCIIIIYEVMSNFRVDLHHKIKQHQLLNFFQTNPSKFLCFRSTSCAALNCKYLLNNEDVIHRQVYTYDEEGFISHKPLSDCVSQKQICRDSAKEYYITFLIFESGKLIVSGINENLIKKIYIDFSLLMNLYFTQNLILEETVEKKIVCKRQSYEKLLLLFIDECAFSKQYIIIRGKNIYISSRKNKLCSKYKLSKIIYEQECRNVETFKMLKSMIKTENGMSFNNVIITVNNTSSEQRLVELLEMCNR